MSKTKNNSQLNSSFNVAEDSSGFLLWKAANLLQRSHSAALRPLGVTPAQFSFMTCLVYMNSKSGVTSKQISTLSGLDKMMVSDLVKTLKKKQLIVTVPNPEDNRSFLISPTALGKNLTNQSVRSIEALDLKFFATLQDPSAFNLNLLKLIRSQA